MEPKKLMGQLLGQLRGRSKLFYAMTSLLAVFVLFISILYGFAVWYRQQAKDQPLQWGVSWSYKYARELGIDPAEGLEATAAELPFGRLRLMSYWDIHEPEDNLYDWSELDEQLEIAKKYDKQVSLAIGLRQPRWPECHMPSWAEKLPASEWRLKLNDYLGAVLERYDSNPAITEYQLENEFFTSFFGDCPDHDRERLVSEYNLVKSLTSKPVVVSRSNNFLPSWPVGEPRADKTAFSVYKRVYNPFGYYEYPYPAWFYASLAGMTKAHTGVDTFIHELQAEPWGPKATKDLSLEEQNRSMDARRLSERLEYAHATGVRTIDLWGGEWYYWRLTEFNDPSLWNVIKAEIPMYN